MKLKQNLLTNIIYIFIVIIFTISSTSSSSSQSLGIAAIVNDDVISLYDLEARLDLLIFTSNQKNTNQLRKRLTRQTLNTLINEKLKLQEANRLKIQIPQVAIEQFFSNMEKRNNMPKGGLTKFLELNGIERTVLLEQIESTIAWQRIISKIFSPQISISEEEINDVINDIEVSKGKPEFLTSEIFLPVNNPLESNEVLKNATRLIEQIRKGASFNVLARSYSQSASAAVGGDLGWIRQGQLELDLDSELSSMKKNSVSKPIRTAGGYYIILKRDQRIGAGLSSSTEKLNIRQVFLSASTEDKIAIIEKAKTMSSRAKNCSEMETLEAESNSPLSGPLGLVNVLSLPASIRNTVKNLPVGKVSAPISSKDGVMFIMICERIKDSSTDSLRPKIKQTLLNNRLNISAKGYIRDLRQAAFVDIRI